MLSERKSKCFFLTQWQCVCISKVSQENQRAIPATKLEMSPIRILWSDSSCGFEKPDDPNSRTLVSHFVAKAGAVAAENWLYVVSLFSEVQLWAQKQDFAVFTNRKVDILCRYFDILHRSTAYATDICIATGLPDPPYWCSCVALNLWSPTTVWLHTTLTRHVPRHSNLALWQAERLPFIHPKQPLFIPPTLLSALWKGPEWPPEPVEGLSVCKWPWCSIASFIALSFHRTRGGPPHQRLSCWEFCCDYDGEGGGIMSSSTDGDVTNS